MEGNVTRVGVLALAVGMGMLGIESPIGFAEEKGVSMNQSEVARTWLSQRSAFPQTEIRGETEAWFEQRSAFLSKRTLNKTPSLNDQNKPKLPWSNTHRPLWSGVSPQGG